MQHAKPINTASSSMPDAGAVAVRSVTRGQRHIGLVHRDILQQVCLLELRQDFELADDPWEPMGYLWYSPNLNPIRMLILQARARQIWRANGRYVPYGFSHPSDCFDATTGKFLIGSSKVGLTCATLVLAVFHFARIQLIDYESWEPRSDDADWQAGMIARLEESSATRSEISARRQAEVGCFRYRPEEVAAASSLFPPPVMFEYAKVLGEKIVAELESR